jgi:hypothetical protein
MGYFRGCTLRLRIRAPGTSQGTSFEKNRASDSRSVLYAKTLNIEYSGATFLLI